MQFHKTDRAHAALADRSFGLSAFERRILILSDGQRTIDTLSSMLGPDARTSVERLVAHGYLAVTSREGDSSVTRGSALGLGSARKLLGSIASPRRDGSSGYLRPPEPAAKHAQAEIATMPVAPAPVPRRSLAASKMYVLDMLQLQRSVEARALHGTIQGGGDPLQLSAALLEALAFLQRSTPPSYSRRVLDRVAEILPEDTLPAFQAQREAIAAAA